MRLAADGADGAFAVKVERVGTADLGNGETVPLVRMTVGTHAWTFDVDLTAPHAAALADMLREEAGGLTIAHSLEVPSE